MHRGLFITFEGPEGSGKTTHIRLLAAYLRDHKHSVVMTREPGGTPFAAQIRALLLDGKEDLSPMAELFLYEADRAQHIREILLPALQRKKIVLCDRYTDSTVAYQGFGRGLDRKTIETLNTIAADGLTPHLTVLLDVPVARGLNQARQKKNHHDRMERAGSAFHRRVRRGFLHLAVEDPRRFRVVRQQKTIEATQAMVREVIAPLLSR